MPKAKTVREGRVVAVRICKDGKLRARAEIVGRYEELKSGDIKIRFNRIPLSGQMVVKRNNSTLSVPKVADIKCG